MKRDPDGYFKFAAQQSDTGMEFQTAFGIPHGQDGLLFVDEGVCYDRSSAALHIAKHLKGIWKVGFLFIIIPKPIRDFVYNQFAKRRYKWFGQKEHRSEEHTSELQSRFDLVCRLLLEKKKQKS